METVRKGCPTCIKTQTDSKRRTTEDNDNAKNNDNNNSDDQGQWFEIDADMKCSTNESWFEIMSNQFETDPYSSKTFLWRLHMVVMIVIVKLLCLTYMMN
jgi:hypothetical protein